MDYAKLVEDLRVTPWTEAGTVNTKNKLTAADAIESLQARIAELEAQPTVNRDDWQQRCLDIGFEYTRAPDDHYVTGTLDNCLDLLREVLGVDVHIDPPAAAQQQEIEQLKLLIGDISADWQIMIMKLQNAEAQLSAIKQAVAMAELNAKTFKEDGGMAYVMVWEHDYEAILSATQSQGGEK